MKFWNKVEFLSLLSKVSRLSRMTIYKYLRENSLDAKHVKITLVYYFSFIERGPAGNFRRPDNGKQYIQ